jgi:copper(I)-binding protein
MRLLALSLLLGVPVTHQASSQRQAPVRVVDPWVRYQGDITAGSTAYIPLQNPGTAAVVVRGVTCDNIRLVLMRESIRTPAGAASAVTRDSLVIPAGGTLAMRPGGMHLMLLGLARPLNVGERAVCRVRTNTGETVVSAPIRTG